jgi:hypothetical protein
MKDIFKRLLDAQINWKEAPGNPHLQAFFEGRIATLRFNDWPDEIMCTILIDGEEQDWEDLPPNWTLPAAPEEKSTDVMRSA